MGRVLVLGGTGFIGHHIVRELLRRGDKVRVLARPSSNRSLLRGMDVEVVLGNIEHRGDLERALQGTTGLVHAAAYYPVYSLAPERHRRYALAQIARIHEALARTGVRRFLYVSSLTAVGRYPDGRPADEDAPFPVERLKSTYAVVKRSMQKAVLAQARRFNTVVIAPTGVIGEGDRKPTTGRLVLDVATGRVPVVLHGRANMVDVRAVAWGAAEALARGRKGRVYVLGGENVTVPGLVARIARIAGVRPPFAALPPKLVLPFAYASEVAGRLAGAPAPLLPVVAVDFARFGEFMSSEVARNDLGYKPPSPIDPAIRRALIWFREHGLM